MKITAKKTAAAITLIAIASAAMTTRTFIENRLVENIAAHGFANPYLELENIGIGSSNIAKISFGDDKIFSIAKLTASYDPQKIISGKLNEIAITGINAEAYQKDEKWQLGGFENFGGSGQQTAITPDALKALPFNSLKIGDSSLKIGADNIAAKIGFGLAFVTSPTPKLDFNTSAFDISAGKIKASIGGAGVEITATDSASWQGRWNIDAISVFETPLELPPLSASGDVTIEGNSIKLSGTANDDSKSYDAAFSLDYDIAAKSGSLTISKLSMPWHDGTVGLINGVIPLEEGSESTVTLKVEHVSIAELMQTLTGENANATGMVSGSLPVSFSTAGGLKIHDGKLVADQPGTISIKPELIPGDNAQIKTAREILQDLHYENLSISVMENGGNRLAILLSVEGKNPKVQKGHPVKLNVTLNGDMLSLVNDNIAAILNPHKLLEKSGDK